jgi:hypothetical protein
MKIFITIFNIITNNKIDLIIYLPSFHLQSNNRI